MKDKVTFFLEPLGESIRLHCGDCSKYVRTFNAPIEMGEVQRWTYIHKAQKHNEGKK